MKHLFSLFLSVGVLLSSAAYAQMDEAAMKAWQSYMTPSDVHKMISSWSGSWKTETTMWFAPDAPPQKSAGTCVNKMLLGGRFQEGTYKGNIMGMPFEGRSTLAYDNAKKVFINTWIDNMSTGMMVIEGPWDAATKSISFTGQSVDPMSGKDIPVREVYTIRSDDHHTMEMWMGDGQGGEFKSMEIQFTRVPGKKG